jgi:hypothetical protein
MLLNQEVGVTGRVRELWNFSDLTMLLFTSGARQSEFALHCVGVGLIWRNSGKTRQEEQMVVLVQEPYVR